MQVTADFRRFYHMRVPQDVAHVSGEELTRLLAGVTLYDGSLTGEYQMQHTAQDGEPSMRLGWHGWNQQTQLLLALVNKLEILISVNTKTSDGKRYKPQLLLPPSEEVQHTVTVAETAQEFAQFFLS